MGTFHCLVFSPICTKTNFNIPRIILDLAEWAQYEILAFTCIHSGGVVNGLSKFTGVIIALSNWPFLTVFLWSLRAAKEAKKAKQAAKKPAAPQAKVCVFL